jgi:hypothetical protein
MTDFWKAVTEFDYRSADPRFCWSLLEMEKQHYVRIRNGRILPTGKVALVSPEKILRRPVPRWECVFAKSVLALEAEGRLTIEDGVLRLTDEGLRWARAEKTLETLMENMRADKRVAPGKREIDVSDQGLAGGKERLQAVAARPGPDSSGDGRASVGQTKTMTESATYTGATDPPVSPELLEQGKESEMSDKQTRKSKPGPSDGRTWYCLTSPDDGRIGCYEAQGRRGPLFFATREDAERFGTSAGWKPKALDRAAVAAAIAALGGGQGCWIRDGKGYGYATAGAMSEFCPQNPLLRTGFTPEQEAMAREAYRKIGHFFDRAYEEFERKALSEARVNYQLRVWVCCARAWEKYFARHPQSKSEHARMQVARYVVLVSLGEGYRLKKKPRQWEELTSLYRETAKEMGLPESSPATVVTIQPGEYSPWEDWVERD